MKIKNYSGYATINKSVASKQLTLNNLKTLGLALVVGAFSSAAIAQQTQDTVILTTGTSWTIPADADPSSISIECWGAGGGGAYTTNSKSAGGGGGGGAYAQKTFTSFTIGQEINYEIGTGGSGGTGTNAGGDTWFFEDSIIGVKAQGGRGVANDSKTGAAGGSGAASFGDAVFNGGKGGNGSYTSGAICGDEQASGGGGAAATLTANGIGGGNASSQTGGFGCVGNHSTAGTGGSNELFSGYTSKGGNGVTYSGAGIAGTNGAGGSGAASNTYKGGDGGDGLIRIIYSICNVNTSTIQDGVKLTANATGATYQWIDCDNGNAPIAGATSKSFTASANGNYAVVVTQGACVDTSSCIAVTTVRLKDYNSIAGVNIFPNPTKGIVNVQLENIQDDQFYIELIDATGRVLSKQSINANSTSLDLTNYVRGLYIVKISNTNNQSVYRIIKE